MPLSSTSPQGPSLPIVVRPSRPRWCHLLVLLLGLGEEIFLQQDAQLLAQGSKLLQVLLVLLLVLNLGLDACSYRKSLALVRGERPQAVARVDTRVYWCVRTLKDPHGGGEVVDPPSGP